METTTINTPHNTVHVSMEKTPQETPKIVEISQKTTSFDHQKLLATLYFMLDAFQRAQLTFFLVGDTARKAMTEYQLEGDHLDIGVRINEWNAGNDEILIPYLEYEHTKVETVNPKLIKATWRDVPVFIHLYEDNPCVTALVDIVYEYEGWKIPNQFERFEKEFNK